jgi:L-lactate utilization protein LutB
MRRASQAQVFITGANGLSLDGEMVNIDGTGNRVASIVYGPESVIVIAGMNKVMDTLEGAVERA